VKVEQEKNKRSENREKRFRRNRRFDKKAQESIQHIEKSIQDSIEPVLVEGLNGFQRKLVYEHFEKSQEFKIKTYREANQVIMKVYPVGQLRRLAELKAQEVLMKGEPEALPPMGSFERFVIHDYLKDREGVRTESFGEGRERHIEINPLFGRTPKKIKRRLT
jgi:hypothetical protein